MISLRVLSTVAAIALVLPMAVPTASFAQTNLPGKPERPPVRRISAAAGVVRRAWAVAAVHRA